jgi:ABC-type multidrug transport system permease subunit
MLRIAALIFRNDFRLLLKDRAALFMLFLAPIVIIAVAGFSLGNIYGVQPANRVYVIPMVDQDHGIIAKAVIKALSQERSIEIAQVADLDQARAFVTAHDRAPLAIVIPPRTSADFESGRTPLISIYVDPIKRLEASMIELRLNVLSRQITAKAHSRAQAALSANTADLRARLERLAGAQRSIQSELAAYGRNLKRARLAMETAVKDQIRRQVEALKARTQAAVDRSIAAARAKIADKLVAKRQALAAVDRYLLQLQSSERDFDHWLAELKAAAGSHAGQIPAPPQWPAPPAKDQLAELSRPLDFSFPTPVGAAPPTDFSLKLPDVLSPPEPKIALRIANLLPQESTPAFPGALGWRDRSLTPGSLEVNSFDQYVPGFGLTFLLIDVLWGVSVGLIDERDWGTLQRLRVSGATVSGILVGKMLARFIIGLLQMVVLFGFGWLLFGITLGAHPWALLLPAAAVSFAAAAFGLVIACIARTRDAVLPIGAMAAMAMAAIGGCWWPIGFEPSWMRTAALWVPTTWTMQAFNDLMIRGLQPSSVLWPAAITFGLGLVYLAAGVIASSQFFE